MKIHELLEDTSKSKFESVVYNPKTVFSHESPANWKEFIHKGIDDDSVFCTVNEPSNFVSGDKSRIWFKIPKNVTVVPDMRYEDIDHLLSEHPNVNGADVAITRSVPFSWILYIDWITDKGPVRMYSID